MGGRKCLTAIAPRRFPLQLEQSVEVLRLEKMQAEDDACQAHRYIEVGRRAVQHDGNVFTTKCAGGC